MGQPWEAASREPRGEGHQDQDCGKENGADAAQDRVLVEEVVAIGRLPRTLLPGRLHTRQRYLMAVSGEHDVIDGRR
jgi:hypothetical protein